MQRIMAYESPSPAELIQARDLDWKDQLDAANAQAQELRVENERLQDQVEALRIEARVLREAISMARQETERLSAENLALRDGRAEAADEAREARKQNERLRAALERLKDYVAGQATFVQTTQGWFPKDGSLALELEAAEDALDRDKRA